MRFQTLGCSRERQVGDSREADYAQGRSDVEFHDRSFEDEALDLLPAAVTSE